MSPRRVTDDEDLPPLTPEERDEMERELLAASGGARAYKDLADRSHAPSRVGEFTIELWNFSPNMPWPLDAGVRAFVQIDRLPGYSFDVEVAADGRLLSVAIAVDDHGRGSVSARDLRATPVGEITRVVRQAVVERAMRFHEIATTGRGAGNAAQFPDSLPQMIAQAYSDDPRPGARGRADIHYARAAALYVREARSRAPIRAVASALTVSPTKARNLIYMARERGLLTTAGQGRGGGELTPKALELLRNTGDNAEKEGNDGKH